MHVAAIGTVFMSEDPAASARWFTDHFGFTVNVDIGWYVNTQHPEHPHTHIDFLRVGDASAPETIRRSPAAGTMSALLVADVDAEEERLRGMGAEFLLPLTTEPWGQRRFQVRAPGGLVVEVLQQVAPDPQWLAEHTG